jgi:amidase
LHVLLYELKADLNAYLETLGLAVGVRSLADVIRFNEENRDREMPHFGQELLIEAQAKGPLTDEIYRRSLQTIRRAARDRGIDAVMDAQRLDAIVAPTGGPAWPTDLVNGDHVGGSSSAPAAIAGYPNISVPAGEVQGLPIGLSFFGRAWSEPTLFRIAYAFEQATRHRRPPTFRPTLA